MISQEEMEMMMNTPEIRAMAQQMQNVGVDPFVGFSFTKVFTAEVNALKFELEKKFGIVVEAQMHITIKGVREQQGETLGGG